MRNKIVLLLTLTLSTLAQLNCIAFLDGNGSKGKSNAWLAFLASDPNANPAPVDVSSKPALELSGGLPVGAFAVAESEVALPKNLPGRFVPVGKVYDVGLSPATRLPAGATSDMQVVLPQESPAQLKYTYDADRLREAGFMEEFAAFYYDKGSSQWVLIPEVRVDEETQTVTVITSHFTPFVLTAIPIPSGQAVAQPPQCITDEFNTNLNGNGARYTVINKNYRYYNDRDYVIGDTTDFDDLGFEGALGIATCNGGAPSPGLDYCGTVADHKRSTAPSYLTFTAPQNLDLYLMYDHRGPIDPSWIATLGFVDTGKTILTGDIGSPYKVFVKSMTANEAITLPGNRYGLTGPTGIDTNYWLVIKTTPAGFPANPTALCSSPDGDPSVPMVSNEIGIAGSDQGTLFWTLPNIGNIQNVIIRRQTNTPALSPSEGEPATGIEHSSEAYTAMGLDEDKTYYFSVFTLDSSDRYSYPTIIELSTDQDTDSDGIKDAYELNPSHTYQSGQGTLYSESDSDNDGQSDLDEIIAGTDPRNPDAEPPVFVSVNRTSPSPTGYPLLTFDITASDNVGITAWLIKEGNAQPKLNDPDWQPQKPTHLDYLTPGTHNYTIWARDTAGNVASSIPGSLTVDITEGDFPRFAYWRTMDANGAVTIHWGHYNLQTLEIVADGSKDTNQRVNTIAVHPSGKYLYAYQATLSGEGPYVAVYGISQIDGSLSTLSSVDLPGQYGYSYEPIRFSGDGRNAYLGFGSEGPECSTSGGTSSCLAHYKVSLADGSLSSPTYHQVWHRSYPEPLDMSADGSTIVLKADDYGFNAIYSVNPDGTLTQRYANGYGMLTEDYGLLVHPNRTFVYVLGYGVIKLYTINRYPSWSLDNTGYQINTFSMNKAFAIHPSGNYMYAMSAANTLTIYEIDQSNGHLNPIRNVSVNTGAYSPITMQLIADAGLVIRGGNAGQMISARFTDATGSDIASPTDWTLPGNAGTIATQWIKNKNQAPLAVLMPYRKSTPVYPDGHTETFPFRWTASVSTIFIAELVGSDPDALFCEADTTNYLETISLLARPTGSTSTAYLNIWPDQRKFVYVAPDTKGSYVLRYDFLDDPGTCVGGAKHGTTDHRLRAGNITQPFPDFVSPGPAPTSANPDSHWSYIVESGPHGTFQPQRYKQLTCRFETLWQCSVHFENVDGNSIGQFWNGYSFDCTPRVTTGSVTVPWERNSVEACHDLYHNLNPGLSIYTVQVTGDELRYKGRWITFTE